MSNAKSGSRFTLNAAFLREIKEDHQQLKSMLGRLRDLAANRSALTNHTREFVGLLTDLVDQLAFHFALEEAYGYFEDALDQAPRFHVQAGKLRGQHEQLFLLCREVAEVGQAGLLSEGTDWDLVVDQFVAFDQALQAHESAELSLIMDAMNLDVGVGD